MTEVRAINYNYKLSEEEIAGKVEELEKRGYRVEDVFIGDNTTVIVYSEL